MMKEMGYDLRRGEGLNFRKGRRIPLNLSYPKKPANYYDHTRSGWGTLSHPFNLIQNLKSLYHHILQTN